MTNKEIAKVFSELASIMELHDENPFKIKSYASAYRILRNHEQPLADMTRAELEGIKGVGKAIAEKIEDLLKTGSFPALDEYLQKTPAGVVEMLRIKGFGPKKIQVIWHDMGIETVGELLYACLENRLTEYKGFGEKTQNELRRACEYYLAGRGKMHFAQAESHAIAVLEILIDLWPDYHFELAGDIARHEDVVTQINIVVAGAVPPDTALLPDSLKIVEKIAEGVTLENEQGVQAHVHFVVPDELGNTLLHLNADEAFITAIKSAYPDFEAVAAESEEILFATNKVPYIAPELRHLPEVYLPILGGKPAPVLVEMTDIRGVLHTHTNYSDGANTLRDMATRARDLGYGYIGITDHSQAAFYANGLKLDRLEQQWAEIDALNIELAPFRIFKGIECDILADGALDYDDATLARFDFIIASVHSNLRMDEAKATERILRAIEHPRTCILGHPTGRLLLSRPGYPLQHTTIIDACAKHNVAIELNANPYRLDLDFRHIPYALECGVRIAINPDAHSREGIHDIKYGLLAARKGGLTAATCLNSLTADAFDVWLKKRV